MEIVKVEVNNLADKPEFLKTVASWIYHEWANKRFSYQDFCYRIKYFVKKHDLPQTFIAFDGDNPVGTVSLWRNDLPIRQDLCPWLSALWVLPHYRGKLVGQQLVKHAICEAENLGYKEVYLITDLQGYYERMGWEFLGEEPKEHGVFHRLYSFETKNKSLLDLSNFEN